METQPLQITSEPLDARRRKFLVSRPLAPEGSVRTYSDPEEAAEQPVARAVLDVPGICEVVIATHVVTAVQDGSHDWQSLEPRVQYAIQAAAAAATAGGTARPPRAAMDDDTMYALVRDIFQQQINPAVAQHGGKVELIDVQRGTVVLRMMGGCQGCGMANVTLRQGIEASLRRTVPGFAGLTDITDHAAGTNPYFAAATK